VSLPAGKLEVVILPAPLASVAVPSVVDPSMNATVPVGVPVPGLMTDTLAVSVTACPKAGELGVVERVADVEACPTVTVVGVDVWPAKSVSPEYTTVIELAPSASVLVEMLAVPLERVPDPSEVDPFMNWTVPDGVPAPGLTGSTVAVRVTPCPKTGVVVDGVSVVVVVAFATATVTAGDVLPVKFESPKYWAVIELLATGRLVTFRVKLPFVSGSMPREAVPLKNWTEPVGVGDPVGPVTVALSATDWPKTDEAGVGMSAVWLASSAVNTTELLLETP
jgi:hypothetical protein